MERKKLLLTALIFGLVIQFIGAWLYFVAFSESAFAYWIYTVTKVVLIALPFYFLKTVELRWSKFFSLDRKSVVSGLLVGLAIGIVILMFFYGFKDYFLLLKPAIEEKISGYNLALYFIPFAIFVSLVHSGVEEYYWRGFIFGGLKKYVPAVLAGVISSIAFASHHFLIVNEFFSVSVSLGLTAAVMIGGLVWCYLYQRTGKLVASWLSHAIVDGVILGIVYFYFL